MSSKRFKWHKVCISSLFAGVPIFLTSIFCSAVIAAACAFAFLMLTAALSYLFDILENNLKAHLYIEIVHNFLMFGTIIGFGVVIAWVVETFNSLKE